MFYNLHQHREATCRRQKEAWEETIKTRLEWEETILKGLEKEELEEGDDEMTEIPIVIWGLEASPSFFDFNNEASEPLKNRIRTLDLLHENYLYNKSAKDGNNYGVRLIKKWINKEYKPDTPTIKPSEYSYDSLITQLSGTDDLDRDFNLPLKKNTEESDSLKNPIHLVYDIFPEWHGLPVTPEMRAACSNKHYMCEKIPDFKKHLKHIDDIFLNQNLLEKRGEIYFVWLGTKQANKKYPGKKACATFFCCLKKEFENIKLYYNPEGFVTKSELEAWQYDCPADFLAFGVPTDWSEHIVQAGYHTVKALRNELPTTVCQKLNGFREEKNLKISILKLDQVKIWFDD